MISPADFDQQHGKNSFSRLRTPLKNPELSYRDIGTKLGLTKQQIAQLAKQMGLEAAKRIPKRLIAFREVVDKDYPVQVAAVIRKINRQASQHRPNVLPT